MSARPLCVLVFNVDAIEVVECLTGGSPNDMPGSDLVACNVFAIVAVQVLTGAFAKCAILCASIVTLPS